MKLVQLSLVAILATGMAYAHDEATTDGKVTHGSVAEVINDGDNSNGEIFGQARSFYIDRTYSGTVNNNRNSWAVGGYAGYMTPVMSGLSAAVAVYGTYGFDIHDQDADVIGSASYDPSLYGRDFDNYAFIGQAYLNYKYENTNFKGGRMRLDTPLAGADDARMLPNLFEAVVVSNTDIENTTLIGAHVFRETVGTFGNIYGGGALGLTSGYGLGMNEALSGDFVNMGTVALGKAGIDGKDNETSGVTALAAIYSGVEGLKLQAWDYIAWDILNAVYLQADYGYQMNEETKLFAAAQYINESDIGDTLAGNVDSNYFAAKIGVKYADLTAYGAYSVTGDSSGAINGGIITPWGGMPAFTQGMVTRHQFFANTDTWKVAATYNFKEYGVKASVYYTNFDVGAENQYDNGTAWTASESGWDIQYKVAAVKGLSLRARANYPRDFKSGLDWDEYRLIANYNF
ncbi:OprD family outer membrane porin [Sulfurovum riftiae]|uniref:Porin n=1 Tax=Sulfurovum riftiae TaxID=1630136 RepID=A0A151CE54_9BACT|nr:OprD family outer membrane porin [Sulfurovum riftiae]KYJ85816.1 hypothetical protein AS592_03500 [Sulfurovum riftiae]